ncbi:hypothetical protein BDB00DRAFT_871520 [Zychaea mexicana]|uniref:uncharacterized protein n=1 Tax=Zychaea mexicana TaxID=64656 RepID=UPI0022FDCBCF|nr:uncharacterized protein BDB00DRAFT_871520 [Zychaea mexicana]KAI9494436.1 hypothetical protein BDB00DRAFT_871520 [Zychaea mexicana]
MELSETDSPSDCENVCPPISTFSRLEGGFANLDIHSNSSRGIRNRTRAVQPIHRPSSLSAFKLREIIGCSEDSDPERHPNLDMVLDQDNKISFDNTITPLPSIYSQQSEDSTDLDDDLLLCTPPPLIGKLFEDDIDEFRDDTVDWIAQIYQDEDADVSESELLPPTMEPGFDKENHPDDNNSSSSNADDYRRKNTKRSYNSTDQNEEQQQQLPTQRRPLGQMRLDDWPSAVIVEHEKKRQPLEVVASTSTGSNSSTSTIGSSRRFVRSLSPSRKGKERAWSPDTSFN